MKSLAKLLNNRKHILFIDLEGTQFTHEMIAFGAVKVDLDNDGNIKKVYPGIKEYVKPIGAIGKFVEQLTGINQDLLNKNSFLWVSLILYVYYLA